jgi:hypothetical protein
MMKRWARFAAFVVFAAGLFMVTPSAQGQLFPVLPPAWRVEVMGDSSTHAAGRLDFVEYIYVESTSFTGYQICKLGFVQTDLTATPDALGATVVKCTMESKTQGTVSFVSTVTPTLMTGTLTWTIGGKTYNYTFKGEPFTPDAEAEG